jgi:hypothetical protein
MSSRLRDVGWFVRYDVSSHVVKSDADGLCRAGDGVGTWEERRRFTSGSKLDKVDAAMKRGLEDRLCAQISSFIPYMFLAYQCLLHELTPVCRHEHRFDCAPFKFRLSDRRAWRVERRRAIAPK